MNGHQVRHRKMYEAISEAVLTSYGWVPAPVMEDIVAHTIAEVVLYQAGHEDWVRAQASKAGYTPADAADMVSELHAPMGGAAA